MYRGFLKKKKKEKKRKEKDIKIIWELGELAILFQYTDSFSDVI